MTQQELARKLLEMGRLTKEHIQHAVSLSSAEKSFAQVVVELGWLTREEILQIDPQALGAGSLVASPQVARVPTASPFASPVTEQNAQSAAPNLGYSASPAPLPHPTGYVAPRQELSGGRKMMTIKKIDVLSLALMQAVMGALGGLIIGLFYGLVMGAIMGPLMSSRGMGAGGAGPNGMGGPAMGAGIGMAAVIIFPIMYAIFGFIGGALAAFIYNVVSGFLGGIKIEVETP